MAEAGVAEAGVAEAGVASGILLPLILTLLAQAVVAVIRWRQQRPPAPAEPTKEPSSRAVGVQVAALATSEFDRQTAVALRALRSGLREAQILDLPPRYDDEELYRFLCAAKPRSGESDHAAAIEMVQADLRWRAARSASRGPTEEASAAISGRVMLRGLDLRGRPCMVIRLDSAAFSKPELFVEELLLALEEHFAGVWRLGGAQPARLSPPRPASPRPAPPPHPAPRAGCQGDAAWAWYRHPMRGAGPSSVVVILDLQQLQQLSGLQLVAELPLAATRALVHTLRAHYPQRAAAIHVVNMPPVLRWALGAICSVLDSRTARKVRVHASAALGLSQHFLPSQLLSDYGGDIRLGGAMRATAAAAASSAAASTTAAATATVATTAAIAAAAEPSAPASAGPPSRPLPASPPSVSPPTPPPSAGAESSSARSGTSARNGPHSGRVVVVGGGSGGGGGDGGGGDGGGGGGGGGGGARRQHQVRLAWSVMSEREQLVVEQLRARCAAAGVSLSPPSRYPDDELLRMLCDVTPMYDLDEALGSCQKSLRALAARPLPPPGTELGALLTQFEPWLKMDGVNREGEPCVFLLINRALQDRLLDDPLPFSAALSGWATALQPCVLEPATICLQAVTPYEYARAHPYPTRYSCAGCSSACAPRSSRPAASRRSSRCCRSSAASASRGRPSPSRRCSS
jgi:hypothetical protein